MTNEHKEAANQLLIVEKSMDISALANDVWQALTEPEKITQWIGGAHVESTWELGSAISFTGKMPNFNKTYRDRGTVLVVESEKVLRYSHWSKMSRRPDIPQNRTIITFNLERMDAKTRLTVRHENLHSEAEYKHANFFWSFALVNLKKMLESKEKMMSPQVETFTPPNTPDPIGPYNHIAKVGRWISIGGTAGVNPKTGQLAGPDVYLQAKQILESFRVMLESVESDLGHIVHVNVFLKDMKDFEEMNRAYVEVLGNHRPARTVIGVSELPKPGVLLTMNLTAVTKE